MNTKQTSTPVYRWDCPQDWLMEKMEGMDRVTILENLRQLVSMTDADTLQDVFQTEMDDDGYFDDLTKKLILIAPAEHMGYSGIRIEDYKHHAVFEIYGDDFIKLVDSSGMYDETDGETLLTYLIENGKIRKDAELEV